MMAFLVLLLSIAAHRVVAPGHGHHHHHHHHPRPVYPPTPPVYPPTPPVYPPTTPPPEYPTTTPPPEYPTPTTTPEYPTPTTTPPVYPTTTTPPVYPPTTPPQPVYPPPPPVYPQPPAVDQYHHTLGDRVDIEAEPGVHFTDLAKRPDSLQPPGDPHNTCTDTSYCGPVLWEKVYLDWCHTTWEKSCWPKHVSVCQDVTEILCDVVAYLDCEYIMGPYEGIKPELTWHGYANCTCETTYTTVYHEKLHHQCKNETRFDCNTKWERDPVTGEDIWTKEDCVPITWKNCTLIPVKVPFKVPKVNCGTANQVPYLSFTNTTFTQNLGVMKCTPKSTTHCVPKTEKICKDIEWEECEFKPVTNCEKQPYLNPYQEWIHAKKCLFSHDSSGAQGPTIITGVESPRTYH